MSNAHTHQPIMDLRRRFAAVIAATMATVLFPMDASIINVALPQIAQDYGLANATVVEIVSAYNLVLAMSLLPLAAIAEKFGLRRVYVAGMLGFLVTSAASSMADGFYMLMAARAIQALATAALLSVSISLVRAIYPPEILGKGLGVNTMAATAGSSIAPVLAGLIMGWSSWHWVFTAGIPFAVLGLLLAPALPAPVSVKHKYDGLGAFLCAVTFGLIIFGLEGLKGHGDKALALACLVGGAIAAMAFVRHERRVAQPVLPVDLLAQPALALSVIGAVLAVLASTILLLFLPFRLHALGFSAQAIGSMIAPYAVAVLISAPLSGMLSDKVSPKVLGQVGLSLALIAVLTFLWLPDKPGYFDIGWRVTFCGLTYSMFFSPNGRLVVGSVPARRAAGASSLLATARMFGQALGAVLMGIMLQLDLGVSSPAILAAILTAAALAATTARLLLRDTAR